MRSSTNTTISLSLLAIATVVVFVALHQTKMLFAPILAALISGIVLTPLSDIWERMRIPDAIAAFLTVLVAIITIFLIILMLEPYVSHVLSRAPMIQAELRETVEELQRLLRGLEKISDDVANAIEPNVASDGATEEKMQIPSLTDALLYAPQFLAQFLIFTGTLYFFLLVRHSVYDWLSDNIAALAKDELHHAASQVSRYVLTISAINLSFGAIVAIAMQIIGMPSPIVWGLLAFLLNFVLYLGPMLLVVMLTVTGIVVFDGAISFLPPALYVAMNATEAQFVTPTLVGKSLSVNPLLVFLSLVFWMWLWGPIGGIIAIPLLIWTLTVAQGINSQIRLTEKSETT